MALKGVICILFVCFVGLESALACSYDTDCYYPLREHNYMYCCTDGVCRDECHYCKYGFQCSNAEACCGVGNCLKTCPWKVVSSAAGGIILFVVFISIVVCSCYRCCAYYRRYRSLRTVNIAARDTGYEPFALTTCSDDDLASSEL